MSASRLPLSRLAAALAVAVSVVVWRNKPLVASFLTGPGSYSRLIALVVVLANYKSFPGVWHTRVFHGILSHMYSPRLTITDSGLHNDPHHHLPALFQPTITPSHSPALECDYNLHKSNSTYFSDLDVTRSHLVCALLNTTIRKLYEKPGRIIGPDGKPARGRWGIMLGAVYCGFKREIKPYEGYEMWSRLLCWDRKWLYVVTHFVRKGAVRPDGWTLEDPATWKFVPRIFRRGPRKVKREEGSKERKDVPEIPADAIFASALSKYVMKVGRLTVHPEAALDIAGLLPPKPGGWNTMDGTKPEQVEDREGLEESVLPLLGIPTGVANGGAAAAAKETTNGAAAAAAAADSHTNGIANGAAAPSARVWDWKAVEAENARGMEYARHYASLDELSETFTGNKQPALGYYTDIF